MRSEDLIVVNSSRGDSAVDDRIATDSDVARIAEFAEQAGVKFEYRQVQHGRAASADIVDVADEVSATLIVIGSRGRSPLGKLLLGSAALEVLSHARQPVVTVKTP